MSDLGEHMEAVAGILLGEPNRHHSNGANLRYGSNGSLSISLEKGTYYSHEDQAGGGVLDLIKREKGLDRAEALAWMRGQGIQVDDPPRRANGHAKHANGHANGADPKNIEATYDYVDEEGRVLFQAIRFALKNPDGSPIMKEGKPDKTFPRPAIGSRTSMVAGGCPTGCPSSSRRFPVVR
jgi:hypothetical protein